ncbi:hypothetical protein RB600_001024 [Gaeumannomyces tritici]
MPSRSAPTQGRNPRPPNSQPPPPDRLPTTTAPPPDPAAPTTSLDSLSTSSSAQPTPTRSSGFSSSRASPSPPAAAVDLLSPEAPASVPPSSSLRPGGASSAPSGSRVPESPESAIEMEPLTPAASHHRRRSSLMNPPNAASNPPGKRGARAAAGGSGAGGTGSGGAAGGGGGGGGGGSVVVVGGGSGGAGTPTDARTTMAGGRASKRAGGPPDSDSDDISDEDLHGDEETGLTKSHRLRKLEKRRRNTRLDQRIARDGGGVTEQEKREADKTVVRRLLVNLSLIGMWYIFSLSISIYNKWMFDSKQLDFPFPMFTTSIHMLIQFGLSSAVLYFIPSLRPRSGRKLERGQARHDAGPERPLMTKWFYFTRIGPCGAATGLDIGLGNTSLKLITLTFYTMCKSSVLAFVLLFAFLFRLETPTWRLFAIIGTMTMGVVMMVAGEVEFKLSGFLLVISAAFFSGFRWGLTQILLLRNPATSNPFSSIFFLAPVMFVTLFSIAIFVEGVPELWQGMNALAKARGALAAPLIVLFPGVIAFFMTVSEFALLQRTSVVTLSIAGIFKEVVTILAATLVFGDKLTPVNFAGLVVTMAAICCYNYLKITKMRAEALASTHDAAAAAAAHRDGGSSGGGGSSSSEAELDGDTEDAALLRRLSADGPPRTPLWTTDGDMLSNLEQPLSVAAGTSPRPRQRED